MIELLGRLTLYFLIKVIKFLNIAKVVSCLFKGNEKCLGQGEGHKHAHRYFITECGKLRCPSVGRLIHYCGISRGKNKTKKQNWEES